MHVTAGKDKKLLDLVRGERPVVLLFTGRVIGNR